jgi:non-heme chloroperoxidase
MSFLTTPDGTRLRYTDRGDGPRTIVLVHGWKGSHRLWDGTIVALSQRFRVVAFDLRGMGESDKPNSSYEFGELSGDLGFLMSQLGLRDVTLVGWSMGCSVSLEYLKGDGAGVSKLVLIAGPIRLTQTTDFPLSMTQEQLDRAVFDVAEHWPTRERRFNADYFLEPDLDVVDWMFHVALQTPLDVVLRVVRHQAKLDYRDFLRRISHPTLAIYGRHDRAYPPELAEWIAQQVPSGESAIFEKSAHIPFIEEPDRFRNVLAEFAARP